MNVIRFGGTDGYSGYLVKKTLRPFDSVARTITTLQTNFISYPDLLDVSMK